MIAIYILSSLEKLGISCIKLHLSMCVCVNGHRSLECVQIIRWWNYNLGQWPIRNLASISYCYIYIIDPPCPILPPPDVLPGGSAPFCPDNTTIEVFLVYTQYCPPTQASPVSVPAYQYSRASPSPVSVSNTPLLPSLALATPEGFLSQLLFCCHQNLF